MMDTCMIDFDGVAFNTIQAICKMYEDDYGAYKDYQHVDWEDINTWEFTELTLSPPIMTNLYFNQKRFFDCIEPMPGFEKFLNKFRKDHHIVFCSIGSYPNIKLKKAFLRFKYPFADFIGVDIDKYEDKSHIDMSNAILIDDSRNMLKTSNAACKICFGREYPWNEGWPGIRCADWEAVIKYLGGTTPQKNVTPISRNVSIQRGI